VFCSALVNVGAKYNITYGTQTTANVDFLQSVVLPNGTAWTFQYSNDGKGDLTQITLPTGGTIPAVCAENPAHSPAGTFLLVFSSVQAGFVQNRQE
jgi:RHS repeat protein